MRTEIHRYLLVEERDEKLPIEGLSAVIAIDYNWRDNCMFWADIVEDAIHVSIATPQSKKTVSINIKHSRYI